MSEQTSERHVDSLEAPDPCEAAQPEASTLVPQRRSRLLDLLERDVMFVRFSVDFEREP